MTRLDITKIDDISQKCLDFFNKLPKTGKPLDQEWTVLSCVVQYDRKIEDYEVVSLGTGSKCIGATKMSPKGDILNDSHAEVVARRSFLLYLYDNIESAIQNKPSIFIKENQKFKLRDNIEFVFFSSQLPCGDASIIPKTCDAECFGDVLQSSKRPAEYNICDTENKKMKCEVDDIHRTGAKCLPDSNPDPRVPGSDYHLLHQVRTKPGRGDRTLSVSCSDKIARWIHLGIQGSLLDIILYEPIYIKHFIFGAGVPYSLESLNRALLTRETKTSTCLGCLPEFYQSSKIFPYIRNNNIRAAPGSIVWSKDKKLVLEVMVQGKRLGVIKKKAMLPSSYPCICKYKLYERFCNILRIDKDVKQSVVGEDSIEHIPYNEMKSKSTRYMSKWAHVKENFFGIWTVKPDIWNFWVNVS